MWRQTIESKSKYTYLDASAMKITPDMFENQEF